MSNLYSANVWKIDTTGAVPEARRIQSIKYIGASSGTAAIASNGVSSGTKIWEESGTSNVYNPDVNIYDSNGVYVTVTNSAVVYLYLVPR